MTGALAYGPVVALCGNDPASLILAVLDDIAQQLDEHEVEDVRSVRARLGRKQQIYYLSRSPFV